KSRGRLSSHRNRDGKRKGASAPEGAPLAAKFRFNAWAKYSNWRYDEKIGSLMAKTANAQEIHPRSHDVRVVLEGGSIDVNGCGTLLTTEECLLSKTQERNPGFTREDYAELFRQYLGITNVLWLKNGIV